MSDDEPANAPERVWLAPDLGDDWSILKVGDAIYWEGIDRHHPDDCETEYVRADIAAARIREMEAELAFYKGSRDGVCKNGTHVVVPVEPTLGQRIAGAEKFKELTDGIEAGKLLIGHVYRAMIRAAQSERQQGE